LLTRVTRPWKLLLRVRGLAQVEEGLQSMLKAPIQSPVCMCVYILSQQPPCEEAWPGKFPGPRREKGCKSRWIMVGREIEILIHPN
jgi:hypothetical protein